MLATAFQLDFINLILT